VTHNQILTLVNPALAFIFSLSFAAIYTFADRRSHLLKLSVGLFFFGIAIAMRILAWPSNIDHLVLIAGFFYFSATVLIVLGVLDRYQLPANVALKVGSVAVLMALLLAFTYWWPNMAGRLYVMNIGPGVMILYASYRLRGLARAAMMDRILFWVLLCFALLLIIRATLTIGLSSYDNYADLLDSPFWLAYQVAMPVTGSILVATLFGRIMVDLFEQLNETGNTDPLTSLLNRRGFEAHAASFIKPVYSRPYSIVMCDVDHFKTINDEYGHATGDVVLRTIGQIARLHMRSGNFAGRIGGEEFVMLLGGDDKQTVFEFSEMLRTQFAASTFPGIPPSVPVTASFGIAHYRPGESLWDTVNRADGYMYEAKRRGRNQTYCEDLERLNEGALTARDRQAADM